VRDLRKACEIVVCKLERKVGDPSLDRRIILKRMIIGLEHWTTFI
jgi:hypothetical protein